MLEVLGLILFLAFLEGILSLDNALVLALMARRLPRESQKKALTYGLWGSLVFRGIALLLIQQILKWNGVKIVGGLYLVGMALQHLFKKSDHKRSPEASPENAPGFWITVFRIELMDIAFAVDSILAAVALSQNFWIVFAGGFLGVVLMRFAATFFLKVLHRFPHFETTAYLLVLLIGAKLLGEAFGWHPPGLAFWGLMAVTILTGFRSSGRHRTQSA